MDNFHDFVSFVAAVSAMVCAVISAANSRKIKAVRDELLRLTGTEAYARGILAGREEN